METEEWINRLTLNPEYDIVVDVKLKDGTITTGIYNDNPDRTTWLIKGSMGLYWRSFDSNKQVTHWKSIKTT